MISDVIALIDFLKKCQDQCNIISALFDWSGKRLEGDERIIVDKISIRDKKDAWFYKIRPLEEYIFIHMPVVPGSVYIDNGMEDGEQNPDAKLFRYVGNIFSSVISGGNPNTKVDFIVIGYKSKDLLEKKKTQ